MTKPARKLAIASFVVLTFVVYSLHQRSEGSQAVSQATKTSATPISTPTTATTAKPSAATFKDGTYTGKSSDAFYGYIQVQATVTGGKLTDVQFLDYPQDRSDSIAINEYAMPQLKQQAIQAQSAKVDGVSGATDTSQAFIESLGDALQQAQS